MKKKVYIADINSIITENLCNVTLLYPQAHKDTTKNGSYFATITEGSKFIAIGTGKEYAEDRPTFSNWEEAISYARELQDLCRGEFFIGIRQAGKIQATPVAKFIAK